MSDGRVESRNGFSVAKSAAGHVLKFKGDEGNPILADTRLEGCSFTSNPIFGMARATGKIECFQALLDFNASYGNSHIQSNVFASAINSQGYFYFMGATARIIRPLVASWGSPSALELVSFEIPALNGFYSGGAGQLFSSNEVNQTASFFTSGFDQPPADIPSGVVIPTSGFHVIVRGTTVEASPVPIVGGLVLVQVFGLSFNLPANTPAVLNDDIQSTYFRVIDRNTRLPIANATVRALPSHTGPAISWGNIANCTIIEGSADGDGIVALDISRRSPQRICLSGDPYSTIRISQDLWQSGWGTPEKPYELAFESTFQFHGFVTFDDYTTPAPGTLVTFTGTDSTAPYGTATADENGHFSMTLPKVYESIDVFLNTEVVAAQQIRYRSPVTDPSPGNRAYLALQPA